MQATYRSRKTKPTQHDKNSDNHGKKQIFHNHPTMCQSKIAIRDQKNKKMHKHKLFAVSSTT